MKNIRFKNSKRAFTIVELVIVIAVISILAAVLIPTFASMIRKAKDAKLEVELDGKEKQDIAESLLGSTDDAEKAPVGASTPILSNNGFAMEVIRSPEQDTEDALAFTFRFGITEERMEELQVAYEAAQKQFIDAAPTESFGGMFSVYGMGSYPDGIIDRFGIFSMYAQEFFYNANNYYWTSTSNLKAEFQEMIKKERLYGLIDNLNENPVSNSIEEKIHTLEIYADFRAVAEMKTVNLIKVNLLFYYNDTAENPEFIFCTPEILLEYNRNQGNID